jgi:mono/diheme cytochrome c family protein
MREIIARVVTVLTLCVVMSLSFWFAARHNSPAERPRISAPAAPAKEPVQKPPPPDAATVSRGRAVYAQQNCASCHAVAGEGNPRLPLDGVGAKLTAPALREWITGTGRAAETLSPATVRRKQRVLDLPAADVNALIAYLSTLKTAE